MRLSLHRILRPVKFTYNKMYSILPHKLVMKTNMLTDKLQDQVILFYLQKEALLGLEVKLSILAGLLKHWKPSQHHQHHQLQAQIQLLGVGKK